MQLEFLGIFFRHNFISATFHFQETECTTVYREDATGTFLGDTQCKGIPVEVMITMMKKVKVENYKKKEVKVK